MEERKITDRQKEVLEIIYNFIRKTGYSPTIIELSNILNVNIKTCYEFIKRLEVKGLIERVKGSSRTISLTKEAYSLLKERKIPVLGRVVAGSPIYSEIDIDGEIVIDRDRFPKNNYFSLKVKGDSMVEAGINEGDYIIIEPTNDIISGDIVVAMIDGEITLKRIYIKKDEGICILHPENKNLKDIIVKGEEVEIIGKVVGLQRFY